ncbi:hypothetical protein ACIA8C_33860 [Nocardia sp. NPDC051321]|uniref:hypothetical protein n=1 Tax=Nocardia sp. NPDC051321 TaxID=3364323 RepID=UPI0037A33E8A
MAHALSLAALHGPGPWPHDGYPLPDEEPRKTGEFILPSVVYDGVSTHHFGPGSQPVAELADRILRHLDDPAYLLEVFAGVQAVRVADDLVGELRSRPVPREKLRTAARFIAERATRREVAKLGIVLLGMSGDERDRELLQLLGTLDEFALFAVVALMNTQPDGQRAVFVLAQRLDGWGRIHAVERLKCCPDPDIKAWLLRSGFRNGVMNEYLAHLAATTGGLYEALLEPDVDDTLLAGAAGILKALANGGPAEDMHDYEDAIPAMHRFAELVVLAEPTLDLLDAAITLERLVFDDDVDWPDGEPARLRARYAALIAQPRWHDVVLRELVSRGEVADTDGPRSVAFAVALSCAGRLGVDALPHALARLRIDNGNAYIWQWAMRHADEVSVEQVVDLAEELLPLAELASGPSESLGLGRGFQPDMVLRTVVANVREYPGVGVRLLPVALANRVTGCRRIALDVLDSWPEHSRPAATRDWITAAAACEPNAELRQDMLAFLAR